MKRHVTFTWALKHLIIDRVSTKLEPHSLVLFQSLQSSKKTVIMSDWRKMSKDVSV